MDFEDYAFGVIGLRLNLIVVTEVQYKYSDDDMLTAAQLVSRLTQKNLGFTVLKTIVK